MVQRKSEKIVSQCEKSLPGLVNKLSSGPVESESTKKPKKKTSPDIIVRLEMFVSFECCEECQVDFATAISRQLSVWCKGNSTDDVLLHAVVMIWTYCPYLDQDHGLPDRLFVAKDGKCYRVYRAPRHPYLIQRKADAAVEGRRK